MVVLSFRTERLKKKGGPQAALLTMRWCRFDAIIKTPRPLTCHRAILMTSSDLILIEDSASYFVNEISSQLRV